MALLRGVCGAVRYSVIISFYQKYFFTNIANNLPCHHHLDYHLGFAIQHPTSIYLYASYLHNLYHHRHRDDDDDIQVVPPPPHSASHIHYPGTVHAPPPPMGTNVLAMWR